MAGNDLRNDMDLQQELLGGTFVTSVLRRTTSVLKHLSHSDVADWLAGLPRHHHADQPVDRLLVAVFPELKPALVRHYLADGPCLFELPGIRVREIDMRLADFLAALAPMLNTNAELRNLSLAEPEAVLDLFLKPTAPG